MSKIDVPVLVVGAGPVGLLAAQLLGRRNIQVMVAEKYEARLEAPKAHALNPRSLEICAAAGLPMDAIHAVATRTEEGRDVRMVTALTGEEIGVLPYERQDEAVRALTPWPLINIEQPKFEAVVEEAVSGLPAVDLRRGLEWLRCDQIGDAVISVLKDRATGTETTIRSRYLIAADGAGSVVRDDLCIPMDGPEALQTHMMIHFEADLRALVADRPAILYFLFGPAASGVLIAYDIAKTWVLMHPCRPDETADAFPPERARALVEAAIGAPVPDLVIKGARSWVMSAQVARRYRAGNAFLVGDAGHRFPPTGGLGLNTGIGDIDNLAWKIAAVEEGWAAPALLETYEAERRAIAQANMGQSLANAMRFGVLFEALGYAPGQSVDPAIFAHRLADPAARARIESAVADQKEHFDSLRLQLGFAYGKALDADATLPISAFTPKSVPGARLPHVPLADGRSTLDRIAASGFTVILCGAREAPGDLGAAPVPLTLLREGREIAAAEGDLARALGLAANAIVIVRPDGHILAVLDDPQALRAALCDYVGVTGTERLVGAA
ncbi:MAG: hypothetical protein GC199_04460 [Alphaproteobacteria bacterium]|nr:hypothetical protein [Alphaproteobacteria bacterium]